MSLSAAIASRARSFDPAIPGDPTFPDPGFPDPGFPGDPSGGLGGLIVGGGAFLAIFGLLFLVGIALAIWRIIVVASASKKLGLTKEQTILAVTDENSGSALITGAIVKDSLEAASSTRGATAPATSPAPERDLASRLASLQAARDQGLITDDEFAAARQRMLDTA